jgi:hypothetical protein
MLMDAFLDIPYTSSAAPTAPPPHPLQTFDFFVPPRHNGSESDNSEEEPERAPLICFVHGGAWRS